MGDVRSDLIQAKEQLDRTSASALELSILLSRAEREISCTRHLNQVLIDSVACAVEALEAGADARPHTLEMLRASLNKWRNIEYMNETGGRQRLEVMGGPSAQELLRIIDES